ncbi:MAG: response regulator [Deltaproteobacteria bacterium]|nr:response regulator [Deltaproteobacteria bacterium]
MTTLLMIDDERELLEVFAKFFPKRGYQVFTAASGLEGLKVARKEKPDLIVLDMRMPKLDGFETLKQLRKRDKKTRVVMLTGYGTAGLIREASELNISDFVAKPFDLHHLQRLIEEVLDPASGGGAM